MSRVKNKERRGHQPKMILPRVHSCGGQLLWEPIVYGPEEWKYEAAKDRIVKMTNDPIGVLQVQICGTVAFGGPERPPSKKAKIPPNTNNMGVGVVIFPPHNVATHEKNFTPVE